MSGIWLHGYCACYHTSYFRNSNVFNITINDMKKLHYLDDLYFLTALELNNIWCYPVDELKKYIMSCDYEAPLRELYKTAKYEDMKALALDILK